MESWKEELYANSLMHYGIKGMRWGRSGRFGKSIKRRAHMATKNENGRLLRRIRFQKESKKKSEFIKRRIYKLFGIKL